MVNSSSDEEAVKALFAVSALIRNNIAGQDMFYAAHGYIMLKVSTPEIHHVSFCSFILWIGKTNHVSLICRM